ncbi:MAG TPA: carbonic anhydrase [Pirellulales bacterium]
MDLIYRYDPYQPIELRQIPDAEAAMAALAAGNDRFADIVDRMHRRTEGEDAGAPLVVPMNPLSLGLPLWRGGAPVQSPFALVVGCADARAPIEAIFDQAFNDLFCVRIAGNILGTECVGSIDYAVRHLKSLRLAVVLGHSECGAVTAAVDAYLAPHNYLEIAATHALRSLVDRIQIAVRGAARAIKEVHGAEAQEAVRYRTALRDVAVYLNAALTAFDLRRELSGLEAADVRVVYSVYEMGTVHVQGSPWSADCVGSQRPPAFADAPLGPDDFAAAALVFASSEYVARLLATPTADELRMAR